MWQRFSLHDVRVIGHYLGVLIMVSSVIYFIPFITALVLQEWEPAARYLFTGGLSLIIGAALRMLHLSPRRLSRQQALAVTGLVWIILALIAAVPLYYSGHFSAYTDALFEAVSGLTTTGASIICDLDHISNADNMFRFLMHFTGGLGLIVVALSLGIFGKGGGASLYSAEARSEHMVPNIVQTAQLITKVTLAFVLVGTAIVTVLGLFLGMEPLRAVLHAFWISVSAFTTGGFAPTSESIYYYHSFILECVLMMLMLCGAINFSLHLEIWNGHVKNFFKDVEIKTMVLWLFVLVSVFAASMTASTSFSGLPAMMRCGLFMIISSFTTTGFQNVTSNEITTVFTSGCFLLLSIAMAIGGGSGSTAGGIKLSRIGFILKAIVARVKETLSPDSARVIVDYYHLGRQRLTSENAEEAMTIFMLYAATYTIGALAGIAAGYDALQSIYESVCMASNGGVIVGIAAPGMPTWLELVYIVEMWAGRLEFITLIALVVKIVVSVVPHRRKARS